MYMYVPVFGEERYTIQEIKRAWLGSTTVDGMQPGRGRGTGVGMNCGYTNVWCRLKTTYMWSQRNDKNISVFL